MNTEYLMILISVLLITILVENIFKLNIYQNIKERLLVTLFFFLVGSAWDTIAIMRGHWLFPANKTLGINIGVMPIEECLFVLVLPYFIITFYKLFDYKLKKI